MQRPFLITLPITVKTYDIDYAAIVHNAVYIRWLEDLRTLLLADHYSVEDRCFQPSSCLNLQFTFPLPF